ncbi:hypothetical protein [Kitasatospora sp. NPDC088783]|uniref:hypothetical protein n=1 Tax=Kitasatospora sp. NPDC088783 TaxID=3364077 RepID=UPI003823BACD
MSSPVSRPALALLSDEDLTAALAALDPGQASCRTLEDLRAVGDDRAPLLAEQRRRARVREVRALAERQQREREARLARTRIGRRAPDGGYPVRVDGAERVIVRKSGRGWLLALDGQGPMEGAERRRSDAIDRAVLVLDMRAARDRERERAAAVPDGWGLAPGGWVPPVGAVVRVAHDGPDGLRWSGPVRVMRHAAEPAPYGPRLYTRPLDDVGFGMNLPASGRVFARPGPDAVRSFPPVPWRHRDPEEHEARRLMAGEIGDEVASLQRRKLPGADEAQNLLAAVAGNRHGDSAAALRRVEEIAEAMREHLRGRGDPDAPWTGATVRAVRILAGRYAERFAAAGGRLTPPPAPWPAGGLRRRERAGRTRPGT